MRALCVTQGKMRFRRKESGFASLAHLAIAREMRRTRELPGARFCHAESRSRLRPGAIRLALDAHSDFELRFRADVACIFFQFCVVFFLTLKRHESIHFSTAM